MRTRLHRPALLAAAALFATASCTLSPEPDIGRRAEAIVDGELATDEPAVVYITTDRGKRVTACTGTLISPRIVLTAQHCLMEGPIEVSPDALQVGFGDARPSLAFYPVTRVWLALRADVGLIALAEPMTAVSFRRIRREPVAPLLGREILGVGFGLTATGELGFKRQQTTFVQEIRTNDRVITAPDVFCPGDSGAPLIDLERDEVFAVHSAGPECGEGESFAWTIEPWLDLIDAALAATCTVELDEICDAVDNDCDGIVDEDTCLAVGASCDSDEECAGSVCRDTEGGRFCTTACDPSAGACDGGLYCEPVSGCEGWCAPRPAETVWTAYFAACTTSLECGTRACLDPGDGQKRCLDACRAGDGRCLADEVCTAGPGACGACFPAASVSSARHLGEPCSDALPCATDTCDRMRGVCTRACTDDSECPSNFSCDASVCLRARAEPGACAIDDDCDAGFACKRTADGTARTCEAKPAPPPDDGCSTTGTSTAPLVLAFLLLLARTRRRIGGSRT